MVESRFYSGSWWERIWVVRSEKASDYCIPQQDRMRPELWHTRHLSIEGVKYKHYKFRLISTARFLLFYLPGTTIDNYFLF